MSIVKHFVVESIKKTEIDEFLQNKLERAGYGGVNISKTPLGTHIVIYAMRPGAAGQRQESRNFPLKPCGYGTQLAHRQELCHTSCTFGFYFLSTEASKLVESVCTTQLNVLYY